MFNVTRHLSKPLANMNNVLVKRFAQSLFSAQQFPILCQKCARTLSRSFSSDVGELSSSDALPQYSDSQQKIILKVLNELPPQELLRFDLTERRAELLRASRLKRGHFESLHQVLSVKGIGQRGVENLCNSILEKMSETGEVVTDERAKMTPKKTSVTRAALLIPTMDDKQIRTLETAVGIHIGMNVLTWAMIDKNNRLLDWSLHDLNLDTKKVHPTALLSKVMHARNLLPPSDVYIMEDVSSTNQPAKQQLTSLTIQLRKSQLASMMLTVLNSSITQHEDVDIHMNRNRVYYLRYRTPARLFRTIVGSERVSAQLLVENIIDPSYDAPRPDHYTPIIVDENQRLDYMTRTAVDRESMCQALLLTMAFMDLVVYRTPQSLTVLTKG